MLSLGLLVPSASLPAADYYMTLSGGASPQTGSSWGSAFAYSDRATVIDATMQPGDTLFLEGNHYAGQTLSINSSGTSTARKRIIGVDRGIVIGGVAYTRPVIEGTSTTVNNGAAITLGADASFWTLQNLEGRRSGWALLTLGNNDGLIIDNVTNHSNSSVSAYDTVHGLGFNDADDLQVINCNVARHVKYGIHLIQGCDNVIISNCHADGTGTGDTADSYTSLAGFMLHTDTATDPMNTNITLEDCSSRNHRVPSASQGDGFLVEYNNTGVNFIRCISFDNLQAGFDAKGLDQTFTDCVSVRVGNGYKIWKNATMYNCIATETTGNVLFLPQKYTGTEHVLTAYNCTFNVSPTNVTGGACVFIESGPSGNVRATLYNCLLTRAGASSSYSKNAIAGGYSGLSASVDLRIGTADETKQHNNAAILSNAPKYTSLTSPWKPWNFDISLTADTAYDSITYGATKGYNSLTLTGALPETPSGLVATGGRNRIDLTWQPVDGATGYTIRRADVATGPFVVISTGITGSTHADVGLADGSIYFYTISADRDGLQSAESAAASTTTYTAWEAWRLTYFGTIESTGEAADSSDPDHDGFINSEEYIALTDPTQGDSAFTVTIKRVDGQNVIHFISASDRLYRIERSETLEANSWTTLQEGIVGTGEELSVTDPDISPGVSRCFYRAVVSLQ